MGEEIASDYSASLEDLTFNSRPLIQMLTQLADENQQYASHLVRAIEDHINNVSLIIICSVLSCILNDTEGKGF